MLPNPTDTSPIHATQSSYMCEKHIHISDMEAFGHDHVEKAMGYEHTVEGMRLTRHTTILCDTIMTTKEIEGNGIFAHIGPIIKIMNLNINITKIVDKEVVY